MIKAKIENWIKETLDVEKVILVHPTHLDNGDFTYIANPENAESELEKLDKNKINEISKVELANARFINIFLSKEFFADTVKEIREKGKEYGENNNLKDQKIFIEHTQPNPFKEFHIGHLMNNAIGESVARIIKANGATVKTASYHGDVGLHVAKAVWFILKNPNDFLTAYAEGHKAYEYSEDSKKEITEINKKIYDKSDESINTLYDQGLAKSIEYFESIYKRLDSNFDFHFYESKSGEIGKELVEENIPKIFTESEGAVVFKGEDFEPKTHTRVFLNKDRLPTYEAKELGLAQMKKDFFEYDTSITITANEQDSFFKVVEVAIGEVFPDLKGKLHHLSHGLLKLPSGKMSSRTGSVITAESLIEQVKENIREKIKDRDFSEEEKESVAEMVAIGAIKFTILKQSVGGDIIFDFDKSLSFEGDSGPYLQYTVVRAKSVLEKSHYEKGPKMPMVPEGWEVTEIEKIMYRFPEVVEKVGTRSTGSTNSPQGSSGQADYSPHHIVNYLIELAGAFNSFYGNNKIIDAGDPSSPYKLALTEAVSIIIQNGLTLLGIKVPERM